EQRAKAADGKGSVEFRAVLQETDREIGRLLDALHEMKQDAKTIVIVSGDNGPEPSFNRARSGGLRGMKWSLYEGGVRTPLIVRWPGAVPAGVVNDTTIVAGVDFFPTLCGLANVKVPADAAFDGEDLSAVFRGAKSPRTKPLLWEYGRKPPSADTKGIRAFPYPREPDAKSPNVAIRDGDWKLLINADGTGAELYNLANDRNETHSLAAEKPDITQRLTDAALAWRKSLP
ncbi:MAG: sulfatase-like hydrolase/transferase, partial [Chthoniobacteraceae bacterium]